MNLMIPMYRLKNFDSNKIDNHIKQITTNKNSKNCKLDHFRK